MEKEIEEAAERYDADRDSLQQVLNTWLKKMYSEEDLREAFHVGRLYQGREGDVNFEKWFEQIARVKK